jgi:polyhydroxyalkanoate synthase
MGENALDWLRRDELVLAERTPYEEVFREDIACVRHYLPLAETTIDVQGTLLPVAPKRFRVPLVLVAPLAVTMRIYDLFPDRSLVKYLTARGFDVYLVDWGRPTARHDGLHLADFFADILPRALTAVRAHSGSQRLSLHGWSFGGLFAMSYAAMGDADIVNLVLLGAPCDYHAAAQLGPRGRRVAKQLSRLSERTGVGVHRLPPRLTRSPGWANSLLFKLTNPIGTLDGYRELLVNLHDRAFVTAHATNAAFLDDMTAYPGAVNQDVVRYLWTDNCLLEGRLPIPDSEATLRDITANLLVLGSTEDTIVPVRATAPLLTLMGSHDKLLLTVPGGHTGILGGSRAPQHIWAPMADWLAARSD